MKAICDSVGLDYTAEVTYSSYPQSEKQGSLASGDIGKIEPNSMKWMTHFDSTMQRKLELIAGNALIDLEYPILFVPGNIDVPAWRRGILRLGDFARLLFVRDLPEVLSGKGKKTWNELASRTLAAWKEFRTKRL